MTLLSKLSALTGPDREVDALIWAKLRMFVSDYPECADMNGIEAAGFIFGRNPHIDKAALTWADVGYRGLAYTASIDAAMTLLPVFDTEDGPQHADFILEHTNGGLTISASVGHNDPDKVSWGATPAIALCIAALKAKGIDNV